MTLARYIFWIYHLKEDYMKKSLKFEVTVTMFLFLFMTFLNVSGGDKMSGEEKTLTLPKPRYKSQVSVEEAILKRRSIRNYLDEPIDLGELSQLLWSIQGITDKERDFRAAPSAGALYPLEVYVIVGNVLSLKEGIYRYIPLRHEIVKMSEGDYRERLSKAALGQTCVRDAAIDIVISGVYDRITKKYGERGIRYTYMEAGHAAQNAYLQAEALNLGTVVVGAFIDDKVKEVVGLKEYETPLYILPVGKK
jgi:SagB-type dehydrogenase family enzyme